MRATVRIVPQDEIARGTGEPPALKLPDPASLFSDRAARLRTLAAGAPDGGGYLKLMASLADAQQAALARQPAAAALPAATLERSRTHGLPPLTGDERTPAWREALKLIVAEIAPQLPAAAAAPIRDLAAGAGSSLEAMAGHVLDFDYPSVDARLVPFIGAALQVHWVHRAAALGAAAFGKLDVPGVCPVCGSPAVASTLRVDIPVPGSRYLHCALCSANWHLPRGQCTQCDTRGKLAYFHIEGGSDAVKAEACEECQSYLKVMNQEKDPQADPMADDLATLALDVLMDESGYQRAGPNLLFVPGQT